VEIYASVDHYGERAEYIRHGTDWGVIENNIAKLKTTPNVKLAMNTVFSVFNALTITDFYSYLHSKGWLSNSFQLYAMSSPSQLTSNVLPLTKKEQASEKIKSYSSYIQKINKSYTPDSGFLYWFHSVDRWMFMKHDWEEKKEDFRSTIQAIDNVRGESFVKVFPELADMMED